MNWYPPPADCGIIGEFAEFTCCNGRRMPGDGDDVLLLLLLLVRGDPTFMGVFIRLTSIVFWNCELCCCCQAVLSELMLLLLGSLLNNAELVGVPEGVGCGLLTWVMICWFGLLLGLLGF